VKRVRPSELSPWRRRRATALGIGLVAAVAIGQAGLIDRDDAKQRAASPTAAERRSTAPRASGRQTSSTRPRVHVYGDSLLWEAATQVRTELRVGRKLNVEIRSMPGSSLCDWLPDLEKSASTKQPPDAVVLTFSGDTFTPCVQDPQTGEPLIGDALERRYIDDLDRVVTMYATTTRFFLIGHPVNAWESTTGPTHPVRVAYQGAANRFPNVTYVEGDTFLIDESGATAFELPCLLIEPCPKNATTNIVRSFDGVHFCPGTARRDGSCRIWSSGAFRYALAWASQVREAIVSGEPVPAPTTTTAPAAGQQTPTTTTNPTSSTSSTSSTSTTARRLQQASRATRPRQ
jgi:hypothetical protein